MKESALVIIKPDGMSKGLVGKILDKFVKANLALVAARIIEPDRKRMEAHYVNIKDKPFFKETVDYMLCKYHKQKTLMTMIYYGKNAIKKCRTIAGATNPEEASPDSVRGSYGRITTKGVWENVVHVSSDQNEARREIKLWFDPEEIAVKLYPTKMLKIKSFHRKAWA